MVSNVTPWFKTWHVFLIHIFIHQANFYFQLGAVNFNILHTILHVIISHLDLTKLIVKFKPEDSGKIKVN